MAPTRNELAAWAYVTSDTRAVPSVRATTARIACVDVIKTARIGIDQGTDDQGGNLPVARLVQLKTWTEGIERPDHRPTYTVLEGPDAGQATLDDATANHIDQIRS